MYGSVYKTLHVQKRLTRQLSGVEHCPTVLFSQSFNEWPTYICMYNII